MTGQGEGKGAVKPPGGIVSHRCPPHLQMAMHPNAAEPV